MKIFDRITPHERADIANVASIWRQGVIQRASADAVAETLDVLPQEQYQALPEALTCRTPEPTDSRAAVQHVPERDERFALARDAMQVSIRLKDQRISELERMVKILEDARATLQDQVAELTRECAMLRTQGNGKNTSHAPAPKKAPSAVPSSSDLDAFLQDLI